MHTASIQTPFSNRSLEAAYRRADFDECIRDASLLPGLRPAILKAKSQIRLKALDEAVQTLRSIAPLVRLAPTHVRSEVYTLESTALTIMREVDASREVLDVARVETFHSQSLSAEASYFYAEMIFATSQGDLESSVEYARDILELNPQWLRPRLPDELETLKAFRVRALMTLAYVEALSGNAKGHLSFLAEAHKNADGLREFDALLYATLMNSIAIAERDFGSCGLDINVGEIVDDANWPISTAHFRSEIYRSLAWMDAQQGQYGSALTQLRKSVEASTLISDKTQSLLQHGFFSKAVGEKINACENLEQAKRLSEETTWSNLHQETTILARLAQEISSFHPESARQIFAKFRRCNSVPRDGLFSLADRRFHAHELIAEAVVLKNSGSASAAVGLLLKAFKIWTELDYKIYAAWAAIELAELDASPRFAEYAKAEAAKFPQSWIGRRCAQLQPR